MQENQKTFRAKTACGGTLKDTKGYPSAIYRGQRIYFCTQACLRAFEREPDRFMNGEIAHPETEDQALMNHITVFADILFINRISKRAYSTTGLMALRPPEVKH